MFFSFLKKTKKQGSKIENETGPFTDGEVIWYPRSEVEAVVSQRSMSSNATTYYSFALQRILVNNNYYLAEHVLDIMGICVDLGKRFSCDSTVPRHVRDRLDHMLIHIEEAEHAASCRPVNYSGLFER